MILGDFRINEPLPALKEPHALAILQPWIDAGNVCTLIISWLETRFKAKELARLVRPGDFFDFTRYRPTSYLREGRRQMSIPNAYVTYAKRRTGNDFLFLHLLEPHSHSEGYIESVSVLLTKFGVKRYCLLGSMYDYVPHTRPLLVTGGAVGEKAEEEVKRLGIESSNYQGSTTITSLISQNAPDMGIETMSLMVHLPQYTQLDEDYMGAVRLMEMLCSLYALPVDRTYVEKAEEQLEQINMAVENDPQLQDVVKQLEAHYEAHARERKEEKMPRLSPEIEKFLLEMDKRFKES